MAKEQFEPENDFAPASLNKQGYESKPEDRLANAAEYAAYQLGQIKVALRRIADALEKQDG